MELVQILVIVANIQTNYCAANPVILQGKPSVKLWRS